MSEKTIRFSHGGKVHETDVPTDVVEFAAHHKTPLDAPSLKRDAKVREFMREHAGMTYYAAFRVVCLGADPGEVENFAEGPNDAVKQRSMTVARAIEEMLGRARVQK
jgi:hypothetical protein